MQQAAPLKYLSIHLDEKGHHVIASFVPVGTTEPVTPHDLRLAINAAGFGDYSLHQMPLEDATAKYNAGEPFDIIVGEALDGKFSIDIDSNLMAAYLSCTPAHGGTPVLMADIQKEAARLRLAPNLLDLAAIDKTFREGGSNVLIAKGKSPVPGVDGRIESLVPSMREMKPRLDEHGLADFRDLGDIVTVKAGDVLIRRIPPTTGESGLTVTGKLLPVKPGKNVNFSGKMDGAVADPNDPNVLVAAISGCPVVSKTGVKVEPVYTVDNVDLHTGNINFSGAVHVRGDVQTDMTIKASGDIHVNGTVGGAMLEAGGDIVVKGGIIGSSEQHENRDGKFHAVIRCAGSCTARFAQNAHITAGSGIFINDTAMLSEMNAGHQVVVGDKGSRKGDIIGGVTRATILVKAKNIGSPVFLKTLVIAGPDQQLHERHSAAIKAREAAETKLVSIVKLLELSAQNPGRLPPDTLKMVQSNHEALQAEIESLREDEEEIQKEIDLAKKAQVIVEKRIFGGTEVQIDMKHYAMTDSKEGGTFRLNEDGELIYA